MAEEDLKKGETDVAEAHVATNLLGPIRLNSALLPHLLEQPRAAVLTVTSGLAYVPLSLNPTYSATKAAIHSYTQAMRYQLADTNVQVIELVPPYVRTSLQGERQANDPNAMPLDEYIAETMDILSRAAGRAGGAGAARPRPALCRAARRARRILSADERHARGGPQGLSRPALSP